MLDPPQHERKSHRPAASWLKFSLSEPVHCHDARIQDEYRRPRVRLAGDWKYGVLSPQDAFPKAKASATKALALDDSLGEAHASLAYALDLYGWNWDAAEREYKRAIALNVGYATAHQWYSWHLIRWDGIARPLPS